MYEDISPSDFERLRDSGEFWQLVDVREAWEVEIASVAQSIHIPMAEIPIRQAELDADKPLAILCHSASIAVTGSVPRVDERFIGALRPGGRLFLVIGESPVMSAQLITREGDNWRQKSLFETDIPAL